MAFEQRGIFGSIVSGEFSLVRKLSLIVMVGFQADTDDASADGFPVHIMGVNFLS
jgi:hypothetical protein